MSYEEYLVWAPPHWRVEWAEGEAIVFMPATDVHQRVVGLLYLLLSLFVTRGSLGVVRTGPLEVKLWPEGGPAREPDVFVIRAVHLEQLGEDRFLGGPDLVVEVISDDSVGRDRETKHGEYARAGVAEYWVVDPHPLARRQPWVMVHRMTPGGRYAPAEPVHEGIVRSDVLPGFWVRAEWLWQEQEPDTLVLLEEMLRYPEGPQGPERPEGLAALPGAGTLLQQGRAEGETRGRAEGLRVAIRRLVGARFGPVPPALETHLAATTDESALAALLDKAIAAPSLDDLL
jgi:Uma2 family endonuclease